MIFTGYGLKINKSFKRTNNDPIVNDYDQHKTRSKITLFRIVINKKTRTSFKNKIRKALKKAK